MYNIVEPLPRMGTAVVQQNVVPMYLSLLEQLLDEVNGTIQ